MNLDEYSETMQLLDLNPKLAAVRKQKKKNQRKKILFKDLNLPPLGNRLLDRLKAVGRSKAFDLIGTLFAILSVIFVTVNN
jgi:hypothetical protein